MTQQQKDFCAEYLKSGNASDAAVKSGYSARSARQIACKLLTRDDVKEYIANVQSTFDKERVADLQECLEFITGVIRDENALTSERLKAADIRLKTLSAYETNVRLTNDTINIVVSGDDEDA